MNIVQPVRTWWKNHEGWIAVGAFAVGVFALGSLFGEWRTGSAYQVQAERLDSAHAEAIKAKDELIMRLGAATAQASVAAAQATDEAKSAAATSEQAAQTAQVAAVHAKAASADAKALKSTVSGAMRAATKPERKQ